MRTLRPSWTHLEAHQLLAEWRVRPRARRQQVAQRKLAAAALRSSVIEVVTEDLSLVGLQRLAWWRIWVVQNGGQLQ